MALQLGSFAAPIYYALYCHPIWQFVYLFTMIVCGGITVTVSLLKRFSTPAYRILRTTLFANMGGLIILPYMHHIYIYGFAMAKESFSLVSLTYVAGSYLTGAIIYAFRLPERFFPGKFDLFGTFFIK